MENLEFRRQFLLSPKPCNNLTNWKVESFYGSHLYIHPDSAYYKISFNNKEIILIGHILNPETPEQSEFDILKDIDSCNTNEDIAKVLYYLTGRFILLISYNNNLIVFNDTCGLKTFFYTKNENNFFAASQPQLLKFVTDFEIGDRYKEYFDSDYVKSQVEHYMPCGVSLYENVYQLVPNHYLDVNDFKQTRFWPTEQLIEKKEDTVIDRYCDILKKTMRTASKKYKLAVSLTAGWDSRSILSGCKEIYKDVIFYTLKYRKLDINSPDIKIPIILSSKFGLQHTVIDCSKPVDEDFLKIYTKNTDTPHINDWGLIANGMKDEYPKDYVSVKGNCAEIGECFYYNNGKHAPVNSANDLLSLVNGWGNIKFIKQQIEDWYSEVQKVNVNKGYDIFDLFYWEHRMGSWQAQSQLEWDIVQDAFTPFNNRALLDILLSIDPLKRCKLNDFVFFRKAILHLWPEILSAPINPQPRFDVLKHKIKKILTYKTWKLIRK